MLIFALLALKPTRRKELKNTKKYFKMCLRIPFCIYFLSGRLHFFKKGQNRCILLLVLLATVVGRWDSAIPSRSPTLTNQKLSYLLYCPR
jgi:hypothetical protein